MAIGRSGKRDCLEKGCCGRACRRPGRPRFGGACRRRDHRRSLQGKRPRSRDSATVNAQNACEFTTPDAMVTNGPDNKPAAIAGRYFRDSQMPCARALMGIKAWDGFR